jgi:tetratricopeptide (TPR) repeat protein
MPRLPSSDIAHTAQTDHRVLVRPVKSSPSAHSTAPPRLQFFDEADKRLPAWEVNRASGLAIVKQLLDQGRPPELSAIQSQLAPGLEVATDDVPVMNALMEVALKQGELAAAESYARMALDVQPQNEAALVALTLISYQSGRYEEGLEFSARALAINPRLEKIHAHRADMLRLSQRLPEGIAVAEEALRLNPRMLSVRQWLVIAYRDQGQSEKSDEQQAILRRMEGAPQAK